MWILSGVLFLLWLILKFFLHKNGYVHMLLISAITLFVIQFVAYRKTKYQQKASKQ